MIITIIKNIDKKIKVLIILNKIVIKWKYE